MNRSSLFVRPLLVSFHAPTTISVAPICQRSIALAPSAHIKTTFRRFSTNNTTQESSSPTSASSSSSTSSSSSSSSTSSSSSSSSNSQDSSSSGESKKEEKEGFFRSDTWTKFVGTVGAFANWTIPMAAITHAMSGKDPKTTIDPKTTGTLAVYSMFFMRWALAITPTNYPLFVCHGVNSFVQTVQVGRWANATYFDSDNNKTTDPATSK